jgi:proteasome lid subunit RPN8/RPN11
MMRVKVGAWKTMLEHARRAYPLECCGGLLGSFSEGTKVVEEIIPWTNAHPGEQRFHYAVLSEDLVAAEKVAWTKGLKFLGIYHSHPDCNADFSVADLKNCCPWHSFVIVSIRKGEFTHANCWLPNPQRSSAEKEELVLPVLAHE